MKKDLAMKWVEALRSGKYKQGRIHLKSNDKYCCLGVLCDITTRSDNSWKSLTGLPDFICEKTGIQSKYGDFSDNESLVGFNDGGYENSNGVYVDDPLTFDEIADIIQICYKEL